MSISLKLLMLKPHINCIFLHGSKNNTKAHFSLIIYRGSKHSRNRTVYCVNKRNNYSEQNQFKCSFGLFKLSFKDGLRSWETIIIIII